MSSSFAIYPTRLNQEHATIYTEHRLKLYKLNVLLNEMYDRIHADDTQQFINNTDSDVLVQLPQISHTIVEIRAATTDDYEFEPKFRDKAIIVQTRFGRRACSLANCNDKYPRGNTCQKNSIAHYFKSGHSDQMACQPACYHTIKNPTRSGPQMFPTFYYKPFERCIIENPNTKSYFIDDYNRTQEHLTLNVDTIGTGFTQTNNFFKDVNGNITPKYAIDSFYCDSFHKNLQSTTDGINVCAEGTFRAGVGHLVGDYITTTPFYIPSFFQHGLTNNYVRKPDVGPVDRTKFRHVVEDPETFLKTLGHCKIIDPHVTLSELGITSATRHMTWTNEYTPEGNLVEPLLVYTNVSLEGFDNVSVNPNINTTIARRINYTLLGNYKLKKPVPENLRIEDTGFLVPRKPRFVPLPPIDVQQRNWFQLLLDSILSTEFLKELVVQEIVFKSIDIVRGVLIKLTKRLIPWFVETLTTMIARQVVIRAVVSMCISRVLLAFFARVVGSAILTYGISILLVGFNLISLILTFVDPLNLKYEINNHTMTTLFNDGFEQNKMMFNERTPELTIDRFYDIYMAFIAKENDDPNRPTVLPTTTVTTQNDNTTSNPPPKTQLNDGTQNDQNSQPQQNDQTPPAAAPMPYLSQKQTSPPQSASATSRSRRRRDVTDATYDENPQIDVNKLQTLLSSNSILYGKDANDKVTSPKVPPITGITKLEKIRQGDQFLALWWGTDYITNLTRNSEGALFEWDNEEATQKINEEDAKKMADEIISDQYINTFLYSEEIQVRVKGAERIQNVIRLCLVGIIFCAITQAIILVCLLTITLVCLISWHNFYMLYTSKIREIGTLQKILFSEIDKVIQ